MSVEEPIILASHNRRKQRDAVNQSELQANHVTAAKARKNAREEVTVAFGLVFHWLRKWREFGEPITERRRQNQSKHAIAFDTRLKTALECKTNRSRYRSESCKVSFLDTYT